MFCPDCNAEQPTQEMWGKIVCQEDYHVFAPVVQPAPTPGAAPAAKKATDVAS